jgi:hypothetical protein
MRRDARFWVAWKKASQRLSPEGAKTLNLQSFGFDFTSMGDFRQLLVLTRGQCCDFELIHSPKN